ncbi:alpha-hydroxy acid oxidase [Phaeobacter italicus]|jgi:L-lactate dehydrogenase (cytochrome)|uniref:alpha-hydroxy acid oxidase n=1 Tax=Phaeobacter italicus TaxID=481446 RepID=UPI000186F795|nr:alpha-hydroxy acid oxidase [Phaeobacter italicus]EEB72722.1 FMN-dependent dehydrogenase [Ruegeria sp. R11]MEE2816326.1 alpha-hydroxy acid oxidase [Pseudomonadota bacterium]MCA0856821.1 alpha-hydroxy-acid oxidizing protein [Phaeobacter italicus]CRL13687.1 (S)-mandelate dehydrogenase [Phaeobacter italicus]SFG01699.1 L-lactate dehydrogenase (cytochrome) [Phaeobacter italicus]
MRAMDLHQHYPALSDLRQRARRRLPRFVWEYLDSGTGTEATKARNRMALDQVGFLPSILHGPQKPDLSRRFLGVDRPLPFGIAPVGMSGLVWPDAEGHLARAAAAHGLPYCLSTVASQSPEDVAPHLGASPWFQLYPPKDPGIRRDMLARAKKAGFTGLVLTVDVPVASRRERQTRSGLTQPPRLTPRLLAQVAMRPAWAMGMAQRGMPHMRTLDKYVTGQLDSLSSTAHVGYLLRTSPDWDYVRWLRDHWQGSLIIKGVMRAEDAAPLETIGVDALWISNHAGRQFDAAPAAIEVLPDLRAATRLPLIFDSGIEGGLDILRALALGADFVMLGRAFHFALAALGPKGVDHLIDILRKDMSANMGQLGAATLDALPIPRSLASFATQTTTFKSDADLKDPP